MRRRARLVVLTVVAGVLLAPAACNDGSGDASAPTTTAGTTASTTAPVTTAPWCPAGLATPAEREFTITVVTGDGVSRTGRVHAPTSDTASTPTPIVFNFHGFGSDSSDQAFYTALDERAGTRGWLVVTPDGRSLNGQQYWQLSGDPAANRDAEFVAAVIDELARSYCLDATRVYATGISNGAGLSAALACASPGRFAAIAPVAGVNLGPGCADGPPVSVIAFHGTADAVVPYAGGALGNRPSLTAPAVPETLAGWATHDRCGAPTDEPVSPHVTRRTFSDCPTGVAVELYTVDGGGHTWPGAIDVPRLGPVTDEIDATALILDFFAAHPRVD